MKTTYKITFPFRGQVKTQLKIASAKNSNKKWLIKPKNVKIFEHTVRAYLLEAFPIHMRPLRSYIRFDMIHYTTFKRNDEGFIEPDAAGDLDNLVKCLQDCFEPIYQKVICVDEGEIKYTPKGNPRYTKEMITPGVIQNDNQIMRAPLSWVPVYSKQEERLEVYITPLREEELFETPIPPYDRLIVLN
jgi:Holliday junction resolvase RusA-like endonuclease